MYNKVKMHPPAQYMYVKLNFWKSINEDGFPESGTSYMFVHVHGHVVRAWWKELVSY